VNSCCNTELHVLVYELDSWTRELLQVTIVWCVSKVLWCWR